MPSRIGWLILIGSPPTVQTTGLVTTPKDGSPLACNQREMKIR
jgi:hypothetical protein